MGELKNKKFCIYRILNKTNNKCYIGSTCNLKNRLAAHKRGHENWQKEFRRVPENFEVSVLMDNLSFNEIENAEFYYIKYFDSKDNGYNKTYATGRSENQRKANIKRKRKNNTKDNEEQRWKYWHDRWEEKKLNWTQEERERYEWEIKLIRLFD